jgi:hypothetical protein
MSSDAHAVVTFGARRTGRRWLLIAISAPVLYALSAGPVGALALRTPYYAEVMMTVYRPLGWLCENTPLAAPLCWYLFHLWGLP